MSTKNQIIMDGFVMARKTRTKITFLASIMICCIVNIFFCGDYYGIDNISNNNHIINSAFAASVGNGSQNQPNIQGSNIYQTQTIILGKNIKNLVILIPNEGHEDPAQPKGMRVINQPYIPENAVVNVGTTLTWLNADAGHRHSITIVDNNTKSTVFNTGRFNNYNASKPFTFNNVGAFAYTGPSYDRAFPNYKMNGTITVLNQPLDASFNTTNPVSATINSSLAAGNSNNNPDTVA